MTDKIKDIGERALLELFKELVDEGDLPFNDDAVAFPLFDDFTLVINIDTLVAQTDVPPNMTAYEIGAKTATMAISDLAAKGVQPLFTIASGAFPENYSVEETLSLVKGIRDISHESGAKFLGGDTNEANDIILSVVVAGIINKKNLMKRDTSKKNDLIFSTGKFGLTGAGFKVFLEGYEASTEEREVFREAIYKPKARLREGLFLGSSNMVNSCIDSSDGLAWCFTELIRNKKECGIIIENIPIEEHVLSFAKKNNINPEELALFAGEEFELIFTINKEKEEEFKKRANEKNISIFYLGKISSDYPSTIKLQFDKKLIDIEPKGWEHFKES